jgi:hypothetical protein
MSKPSIEDVIAEGLLGLIVCDWAENDCATCSVSEGCKPELLAPTGFSPLTNWDHFGMVLEKARKRWFIIINIDEDDVRVAMNKRIVVGGQKAYNFMFAVSGPDFRATVLEAIAKALEVEAYEQIDISQEHTDLSRYTCPHCDKVTSMVPCSYCHKYANAKALEVEGE